MRALLLLALAVVAVEAKWHAWKPGVQYEYELRGRTVTGLHQVSNQYTGILLKAKIIVQPFGENSLSVSIQNPKYAELHANLSSGWSTDIPDKTVTYQALDLTNKPFELKLSNGLITKILVDNRMPTWEINMLKGIASQLQILTQNETLKKSRADQYPTHKYQPIGFFKTMEGSVEGKCETLYDISTMPEYELKSTTPEGLQYSGRHIKIVKTKNYSNCDQRMVHHFGFTGLGNSKPDSSHTNVLSRVSVQKLVLSGTLDQHVILSSVSINKIIIGPHMHNHQKGIVASRVELTLNKVSTGLKEPQHLSQPKEIESLVYEYNRAPQDRNKKSQDVPSGCGSDSSSSNDDQHQDNSSSESSDTTSTSCDSNKQSNTNGDFASARSRRSIAALYKQQSDPSSSNSGSSRNYFQSKPTNNLSPQPPFLPFSVGYQGNSIHSASNVDAIKNSIAIVDKIASELLVPNVITGQHTLTSFNILARVIRIMTERQINEVGEQLYVSISKLDPRREFDSRKYLAWVVFRDAVTQAGTGPALITLTHWIKEHKVEGEEAAQLLSVLPNVVRYPTEEYIDSLFALITNPVVAEQEHLNSTALHIFTTILSQVHKYEQQNRYPIYSFGRFFNKKAFQQLNNQYLPYLDKQLNKSVVEGSSRKIQVYIRALGNIGHPKILPILEPYLEGKNNISNFQRLVVVTSLDRLIQNHPKISQRIFYKIYKNTVEVPELRMAAVIQLMKTNPSAQTLQRMAQFTNYEHNKQVNSAVKSAIESAAQLRGSHNRQLALNAKSAVNLLTQWQYGIQYSKDYIKDFEFGNVKNTLKLATVQSEDNVWPSSIFFDLSKTIGGLVHPSDNLNAMTSSASSLINQLMDQFSAIAEERGVGKGPNFERKKRQTETEEQWNIENILSLLNITNEVVDQVEGNVKVSWAGVDRFFAFDNNSVEQIPGLIRSVASSLGNGQSFNYTKLLVQKTIKIGFPTVMGLPFVYSLEVPTLVSVGGEVQLRTSPDLSQGSDAYTQIPRTLNLTTEIVATYVSKTQSKLGFVTPFNHHHYLAGYDTGLYVHLPLRSKINVDTKNSKIDAEIQPLDLSSSQKLAEFSSLAYTTKHDVFDLTPVQINKDARQIHTSQTRGFEVTVGESTTGFAFDMKAETEQKFIDYAYFMRGMKTENLIATLLNYNNDQIIKPCTNYSLTFNPKKSTAEEAKFYFNYAYNTTESENSSSENEAFNGAIPSSYSGNSQNRTNQFLKRVSSGISDASAHAVDALLEFSGETNIQYILTAAYGSAPASIKSRALLFTSSNSSRQNGENDQYMIAVDMISKTPKIPLVHYRKAIDANPASNISSTINFGESLESSNQIKIESILEQSQEYIEELEQDPLAHECEKQMLKGNNIQPACRNVTARANLLDRYSITAQYDKLPQGLQNATFKVYSALREMFYNEVSEDFYPVNTEGQLNLNISFSLDLTSLNTSIATSSVRANVTNLQIGPIASAAAVIHPEYGLVQRLGQLVMRSQQYPVCSLDELSVTTFDNGTYNIHLGKFWYVVAVATPRYRQDSLTRSAKNSVGFSILVRDVMPNQREVMMVLDEDIILLEPYSGSASDYFMANGKKYGINKDRTVEFKDVNGDIAILAFKLPSGEARIISLKYDFDVIYDGLRIKLQMSNTYRKQLHGLCGDFNGEKSTDLKTPQNCLLQDMRQFMNAYAIKQNATTEEELNDAGCYQRTFQPTRISSLSSNSDLRLGYMLDTNQVIKKGHQHRCSVMRTMVVFQGGLKCYSKVPHMACLRACTGIVKRVVKQVEFSCLPLGEVPFGHIFPASPENIARAVNITVDALIPIEC